MKRKTRSAAETSSLARETARKKIKTRNKNKALVFGLTGDLGAGKTTFIKAFIKELGVRRKITSPTFLILRRFGIKQGDLKNVFHVDAYRLGGKGGAKEVGLEEALKDKSSIVLVEWADRIKNVLPKETIWVKFKYGKEHSEREITIN